MGSIIHRNTNSKWIIIPLFVVLWHLLYLTSCHNKNADLPDKKAMSETITSGFNASDSLLTALIGNYQNLGQMLDSIEILQQQFDTIGQSKLMNRIANICRNTGNYQEALVYYNRSQQLLKPNWINVYWLRFCTARLPPISRCFHNFASSVS